MSLTYLSSFLKISYLFPTIISGTMDSSTSFFLVFNVFRLRSKTSSHFFKELITL